MRSSLSVVLTSLVLATACGQPAGTMSVGDDFQVVVDTTAPFANAQDFPGRVESTAEMALDYWGGSWSDLRGRTLTLTDDPYVDCNGAPSLGCYDGSLRVTTQDPSLGTFSCVEATVLVHEIGHAVIGDQLHEDPRWMEMDALGEWLSNRVGYTREGEAPCAIYLSVWRHPHGRR